MEVSFVFLNGVLMLVRYFRGNMPGNDVDEQSEKTRCHELKADLLRLKVEEQTLDEQMIKIQAYLKQMSEDDANRKLAFVSNIDIRRIPSLSEDTLFAIKAPFGSTLEVPDPDDVS